MAFRAVGIADPLPHVRQDPALIGPIDAAVILADPGPALDTLGWRPTIDFSTLVREMVEADVHRVRSGVEESPSYLIPLR